MPYNLGCHVLWPGSCLGSATSAGTAVARPRLLAGRVAIAISRTGALEAKILPLKQLRRSGVQTQ